MAAGQKAGVNTTAGMIVCFGRMFIRDMVLPLNELPAWLQTIVLYFPLYAVVQLVRAPLPEGVLAANWPGHLALMAAYALVAALQTIDAGLGAEALDWLDARQPLPVELTLTTLIHSVASGPQEIVLVLDDYRLIETSRSTRRSPFCSTICRTNCIWPWRLVEPANACQGLFVAKCRLSVNHHGNHHAW